MRPATFAACAALLLAGAAAAQFRDRVEPAPLSGLVLDPGLALNHGGPLLDPSRMTFSQSVSMGVVSGGGGSLSAGSYLNQLDYRLNGTMDLRLDFGVRSVLHNSYWENGTGQQLVGGAAFTWRPSENFRLQLAASRGLPQASPFADRWRDPWGWDD